MIVRVVASDEVARAREMLGAVFASLDAFNQPFAPIVARRLILYPAEGYELSDVQWSAVVGAAGALGETSAYYANVEGASTSEVHPVWEVPLSPVGPAWFEQSATDGTRDPIVESALWSAHGRWGLLISHEQHLVVGGRDEFVGQLRACLRDADRQAIEFARAVTRYSDGPPSWLPGLFAHIYGASRASELLNVPRG